MLQGKSRRVLLAIARRLGRLTSGASGASGAFGAAAGPAGAGGEHGTVLISAGGIDSGAEAYARLRAGASLVQLYTALVYEGPSLPGRINRELLALLARDGFSHVGEAIGADL